MASNLRFWDYIIIIGKAVIRYSSKLVILLCILLKKYAKNILIKRRVT